MAIVFGVLSRGDGIAMTTNDHDAVCPTTVKPYLRTLQCACKTRSRRWKVSVLWCDCSKRTRRACGDDVVAGFSRASVASEFSLNAASTSFTVMR